MTVSDEDISRFSQLYHMFIRQNLSSQNTVPDEIRDLSALDISVINVVDTFPNVIVREIAEQLNVPNSTLTSSLNRLEKKGIANRIISSRDRRSFGLELTEKGMNVQRVHLEFERAFFKSILEKLDTNEDRSLLLGLMNKIISADGTCERSSEE